MNSSSVNVNSSSVFKCIKCDLSCRFAPSPLTYPPRLISELHARAVDDGHHPVTSQAALTPLCLSVWFGIMWSPRPETHCEQRLNSTKRRLASDKAYDRSCCEGKGQPCTSLVTTPLQLKRPSGNKYWAASGRSTSTAKWRGVLPSSLRSSCLSGTLARP